MCKYVKVFLIFIAIITIQSCTGPHIWVGCSNQTDYNASLYLKETAGSTDYVIAAPPGNYEDMMVDREDLYQWRLRLYTDKGEEVFADSAEVNIKYTTNECTVEQDANNRFVVTWTLEE